jgi:transcriptional regulator with XRE-family HTH domain
MANAEGAGDRIAQALKDSDLRPADLARRLKVSQPTVHGWVNQLHGITWANARRVAAVLKVSPGWIMFGADEEAERVAQTAAELAFLRLFREVDDPAQASVLRLMTAMPRVAAGQAASLRPARSAKAPDGPLAGQIINSPDEQAWVAFWRGLDDEERVEALRKLQVSVREPVGT